MCFVYRWSLWSMSLFAWFPTRLLASWTKEMVPSKAVWLICDSKKKSFKNPPKRFNILKLFLCSFRLCKNFRDVCRSVKVIETVQWAPARADLWVCRKTVRGWTERLWHAGTQRRKQRKASGNGFWECGREELWHQLHETHFARLYKVFNVDLELHKFPEPLLTTAVNRHEKSWTQQNESDLLVEAPLRSLSSTKCFLSWGMKRWCCCASTLTVFKGNRVQSLSQDVFLNSYLHGIRFHFQDECSAPWSFILLFYGLSRCFSWRLADWTFSELPHTSSSCAMSPASHL